MDLVLHSMVPQLPITLCEAYRKYYLSHLTFTKEREVQAETEREGRDREKQGLMRERDGRENERKGLEENSDQTSTKNKVKAKHVFLL